MAHDAFRANFLRSQASALLEAGNLSGALGAAEKAIEYAAASLPSLPLANSASCDAQALFDWAVALEMKGIVMRHSGELQRSLKALSTAHEAMARILPQFPMAENYAAMARILHHRSNTRLALTDLEGAGGDATMAIRLRRQLNKADSNEADLLAGSLKMRSSIFLQLRQNDFALRDITESVAMRRSALPSTPDFEQQKVFAMTIYSLALVQRACGQIQESCTSVSEAICLLEELLSQRTWAAAEHDIELCRILKRDVCSAG
jgi:tetratricopeptide (TPR) repeat protein